MKLDYVLGLRLEDFLERRLQTQVFKLGLISSNLNYDPRALALLRTFPRYQKRLETSKGTKWHSKPPCLSPPFCALYGWSLHDFDVLICPECGEVLLGTLPPRGSENYASRLDKILTGLLTNHSEVCHFRQKPEPFEFFKRDDSVYLYKTRLLSYPEHVTLPEIVENSEISAEEFDQIVNFSQPFVKNSKNLRKIVS